MLSLLLNNNILATAGKKESRRRSLEEEEEDFPSYGINLPYCIKSRSCSKTGSTVYRLLDLSLIPSGRHILAYSRGFNCNE